MQSIAYTDLFPNFVSAFSPLLFFLWSRHTCSMGRMCRSFGLLNIIVIFTDIISAS